MHETSETGWYRLTPGDTDVVRLAQLTDCHILAGATDRLKGMNTRASFEAVCRALLEQYDNLDLLLATGDLSQDASAASYQYLAQRFVELRHPVFWLPGNHDDVATMQANLCGEWIHANKKLLAGNWLIVLLDSTVPGATGGHISPAQLAFLDQALQEYPEKHALVSLHHQALAANSEWLDQLGLDNSGEFYARLKSHANLRAVLWGHVHQQSDRQVDGIEWMSTPSSCVQFRPASATFALDDLAPGYRYLELHADGQIVTGVNRLPMAAFNALK